MIYWGGSLPTATLFAVMIAASAAAGAVWGLVPALFKAKWKTNETLFTLMLNYVAIQLTSFFVAKWENPYGSITVGIFNRGDTIRWFRRFGQQYFLETRYRSGLNGRHVIYSGYQARLPVRRGWESEKTTRADFAVFRWPLSI
jgi:hypothetical protein